jgi:hypothetical protein
MDLLIAGMVLDIFLQSSQADISKHCEFIKVRYANLVLFA